MEGQAFDSYVFSGSYRKVGEDYGEALRGQIRENYEKNLEKLISADGLSAEKLRERVAAYYALCERYSGELVEQLRGEGRSSGIGDFGAMLLNVAREIRALELDRRMECTSFAVGGSYTADGRHYSGQNQDMANGYQDCCSIVTFAVPGKPKIMFLLPAGNLAFSGMNSEGISCNRNFLFGSPWKFALPRYFSTRLALENRTLEGVKETMDRLDFPSSHHSLFADRQGRILSYELDARKTASGSFRDAFVHTNHFLLPEMLPFEKRTAEERKNSAARLDFLRGKFEELRGKIDLAAIEDLLSSHENAPDCVCVHDRHGSSTVASMINCLDDGVMYVSKGNPCENGYRRYSF